MSKEHYEAIITVTGVRAGKRYYEDYALQVPVDLARGLYEKLSDLQVREFIHDLQAEQQRRAEVAEKQAAVAEACGGYDPFQALRRSA